ncbi:MAG: RHS repeat-associated core domain-containing protein [Bryobacterales bacterium]|nr:RHS repeat-associated core domain-containing protein [Bryobacterales bacterium]
MKKTTGASSTWFIYDASGQLAAEYTTAGPSGSGATHYLTTDHLGSTRLVTDASKNVISRHDYLPFGYEIYTGITSRTTAQGYSPNPSTLATPTQRFTGKERDAETGLDYFGARYLSGAMGRFTSPDEWAGGIVDPFTGGQVGRPRALPYADITDPQTINKYAYVRNSPLRYTDPDGHCTDALTCTIEGVEFGSFAGPAGAVVGGVIGLVAGPVVAAVVVEGLAQNPTAAGSMIGAHAYLSKPAQATEGQAVKQNAQASPDGNKTGPVKAKDAPGVTAGGQATDKYGNKLGPSGDVQVNKTHSTTREGARN